MKTSQPEKQPWAEWMKFPCSNKISPTNLRQQNEKKDKSTNLAVAKQTLSNEGGKARSVAFSGGFQVDG